MWLNENELKTTGVFGRSAVDFISRSSKFSQTESACRLAWISISTGRPCCSAHLRLGTMSAIFSVYTVQNEVGRSEERYAGGAVGTEASRRNGMATDSTGTEAGVDSNLQENK